MIETALANAEEERPVPKEIARSTESRASSVGCAVAAIAILFPLALYFGVFVFAYFDEVVFGSNYLRKALPDGVYEFLGLLYTPLVYLVRKAGLI